MSMWRELTFSAQAAKDAVLVVEGECANILADPLRWRILEILGAGKSVAEISQRLDVTDARVLCHVQRLARTGVVRMEEDGADPRAWRCLPVAGAIRVRVPLAAAAVPAAVVGQFNQAFREAADDGLAKCLVELADDGQFNQAFREAAEGLYGATFQQSVNHNRARLSERQAAEFSRRLLALIEEYFPPGKGDRQGVKYGFYGVFTPIDLHPLGDSETEE